jgi:hypothetical protein
MIAGKANPERVGSLDGLNELAWRLNDLRSDAADFGHT